jgi:hypothetical protein
LPIFGGVTGRLRPAQQFAHATAVHELLSSNTSAGLELDRHGLISAADERVSSLLWSNPEALIGRAFHELIAPDDHLASTIQEYLGSDDPTNFPTCEATFINVAHAGDGRSTARLELQIERTPDGARVHLSDVRAWNLINQALRTTATDASHGHDSPLVLLNLDRQCRALHANYAWLDATGITAEADTGLMWLRALDTDSLDSFRNAIPVLCTGTSFRSDGYLRTANGGALRTALVVAPIILTNGSIHGFLLVASVQRLLSPDELVAQPGVLRFPPLARPAHADPERDTASQPDTPKTPANTTTDVADPQPAEVLYSMRPIATDPDPVVRMALWSVLNAARSDFVAPLDADQRSEDPSLDETDHEPDATRTKGDASDGHPDVAHEPNVDLDYPPSDPAGMKRLDPTRMVSRRLPRITPPPAFVDSDARNGILHHLEAFHADGMDDVVGVALLFIDVLTTGSPHEEDRRYDLRLLERRLRTAVREHEYAAPLGSQGFVVAARGTLNPADLQALAQRLATRLSMTLRGHGGTRQPKVSIGGTRSLPNEPDVQLILRAELARAKALALGPGALHLD